jgi:glycine cleavage system H lipoate-binding protein
LLRKISFLLVMLTLILGISSAAYAQKATVQRVVVVKTDNVDAYVQMIAKAAAIEKKLGIVIPTKVWQATFAGPNAGMVVATLEFPDMNTLADDYTKLNADPDYQAWIVDLNKIRTIASDSIYKELY